MSETVSRSNGAREDTLFNRNSPACQGPSFSGEASSNPAPQNSVESLRIKAELLQSILDSLSDGLVAVDRNGTFIQFNPSSTAILGKGPTEGPSENWPKDYGLFLPDTQTPYPHDQLPLIRALRGERARDVEMYLHTPDRPDGRWLKVSAAPMQNERRETTGAVVLFRDDTAAKQTQQSLEAERRFLRHLIQVQDRDRQLTAYDLHDGIVQLMTGALLHLEAYRSKRTATIDDAAEEEFSKSMDLLRESLDEARRLIGGLRPTALDERGIAGAVEYLIEDHAAQSQLHVDFVHDLGSQRLSSIVETTLFRIVQEALRNVVRHAETDRAAVSLRRRDHEIELEIRDWGRGFNLKDRKRRRYGLRGIEERSRLLGGNLAIESEPGRGTRVHVTLPADPTPFESDETET